MVAEAEAAQRCHQQQQQQQQQREGEGEGGEQVGWSMSRGGGQNKSQLGCRREPTVRSLPPPPPLLGPELSRAELT